MSGAGVVREGVVRPDRPLRDGSGRRRWPTALLGSALLLVVTGCLGGARGGGERSAAADQGPRIQSGLVEPEALVPRRGSRVRLAAIYEPRGAGLTDTVTVWDEPGGGQLLHSGQGGGGRTLWARVSPTLTPVEGWELRRTERGSCLRRWRMQGDTVVVLSGLLGVAEVRGSRFTLPEGTTLDVEHPVLRLWSLQRAMPIDVEAPGLRLGGCPGEREQAGVFPSRWRVVVARRAAEPGAGDSLTTLVRFRLLDVSAGWGDTIVLHRARGVVTRASWPQPGAGDDAPWTAVELRSATVADRPRCLGSGCADAGAPEPAGAGG